MKLKHTIRILAATAVIMAFTLLARILGPSVEETYFAVATENTITDVYWDHDTLLLDGEFTKTRACKLKNIVATVVDDSDTERVKIDILDDYRVKARPLPVGRNHWGPWAITLSANNQKNTRLIVYSQHICHSFYLSRSKMVDLDLDTVKKR